MIPIPILYNDSHTNWDAINNAKARESNEKYFKAAEKELPDKIRATGLFNVLMLPKPIDPYGGIACYLTSKKYPNIFAHYVFSSEHSIRPIEFRCYITEHKWTNFHISDIQFLNMVGFNGPTVTYKWWQKLFFGCTEPKPAPKIFTKEQFEDLMERAIKSQGYYLQPYKFHLEYNTMTYDWDIEEAKKYSSQKEVLLYTLSTPTAERPIQDIIQHKICYNQYQWLLLQNFVKRGGSYKDFD